MPWETGRTMPLSQQWQELLLQGLRVWPVKKLAAIQVIVLVRPHVTFCNTLFFEGEELLSPG
jgi:hypothetical protein